MKRLLLIMVMFCFIPLAGLCPAREKAFYIIANDPIEPYLSLFNAVCMIESSGRPMAFNKDEQAYGITQIREIRLKDYNKRTGKNYTLTDCYDKEISKSIFIFYATKYEIYDLEHAARKWNGSGNQTKIYWQKVKKHI
jgi:hypothetical protein